MPGLTGFRHHRGYGLCIDSNIALPYPAASPFPGEPQVSVRRGEVPRTLDSPVNECGYWQTKPGSLLLNAEGIARCMVSEGGRSVRIAPAEQNPNGYVCMLDSVLASCLHMIGVLPLYASAIATEEGAVLFASKHRTHQSILTATLIDLGYPLVADGMVGIAAPDGSTPLALGGFPQIQLWEQAMELLGKSWRDAAGESIRPEINSYAVPVPRFHVGEIPVRTVYFISPTTGEDVIFEPLTPVQATAALLWQTVRLRFLRGLGKQGWHLRTVAAVARCAAVEGLRRPRMIAGQPATLAARVAERLPLPA